MTTKRGHELEVGDVIAIWTERSQYRIAALEPYSGSLGLTILKGARTARLTGGVIPSITIEANAIFEVY